MVHALEVKERGGGVALPCLPSLHRRGVREQRQHWSQMAQRYVPPLVRKWTILLHFSRTVACRVRPSFELLFGQTVSTPTAYQSLGRSAPTNFKHKENPGALQQMNRRHFKFRMLFLYILCGENV